MFDKLFDFQREDVKYLAKQPNVGIFSDMGIGKTYEAVALDGIRRRTAGEGPTLVVAPLSVLSSWEQHFRELTDLKVSVIDPKRRHALLSSSADVYCAHWEALRLLPKLVERSWLHLIADECHKAKNRKAAQTKALKKIKRVGYRTGMTGTPVINRPDDLWSVLNWLYPKKHEFRSYWRFFYTYVEAHKPLEHCPREDCTTAEDYNPFAKNVDKYYIIHGPKNVERLQRVLTPFTVRRFKKDVMSQLPEKYYTTLIVNLSPTQQRLYNEMKEDMLTWLDDGQPLNATVVIAQLIRLQQIALATPVIEEREVRFDPEADPGNWWLKKTKEIVGLQDPSTKLDALMERVESTDRKIVVFTQFLKMANLTCSRLQGADVPYTRLTGSETGSQRSENIQRFQRSGGPRVLVGTIKAGGVGITLTAADTVIFLDRDWSPAFNSQAEDRLHRYGQRNAVQVIDITARGTVDIPRGQKLELKHEWIRRTLGDK